MTNYTTNVYYGWRLNKKKITSYIIKKYKHLVAEKYKNLHIDEQDIVIENDSHHLEDFDDYENINYGFEKLKFISVLCVHTHKKIEYAVIHDVHIQHEKHNNREEFDPEELKNKIPKEDLETVEMLGGYGTPKLFFIDGTEKH